MSDEKKAERPQRTTRAHYRRFTPVQTRWRDNDIYGHVNNVVYFEYFDTAVNAMMIEAGALDISKGEIIGLVVDLRCSYFASVAFPEKLDVGIAVERLGRSSVTYRLALFRAGDNDAAAQALFTHVYVTRATQAPVAIPDAARAVLESLR